MQCHMIQAKNDLEDRVSSRMLLSFSYPVKVCMTGLVDQDGTPILFI
jgi:hypothetical protein